MDFYWPVGIDHFHDRRDSDRMAAKKAQSPAMAFLLAALEKDRGASYGDLKAAAEKKDLKVLKNISRIQSSQIFLKPIHQ